MEPASDATGATVWILCGEELYATKQNAMVQAIKLVRTGVVAHCKAGSLTHGIMMTLLDGGKYDLAIDYWNTIAPHRVGTGGAVTVREEVVRP